VYSSPENLSIGKEDKGKFLLGNPISFLTLDLGEGMIVASVK
jgi:hypothetical protein